MKKLIYINGEATYIDLTADEIAERNEQVEPIVWHKDKQLRAKVPMSLVRENKEKIEFGAIDNEYLSQLLTYMLATDTIQRVIENDNLFAYFDMIYDEHKAILASVNIIVELKN
jgi:hypothetical protein